MMTDKEKIRRNYLAKNTIIFFIGNFGQKIISFLLIPLYTNVLKPDEYGTADLITTICAVLAPILILNISEAVMRFELDSCTDKNEIFKIGFKIFEFSIIFGALLIPIYMLFPPIREFSIYIYIYNISIGASTLFLYDLRGKELLLRFSIGGIICTLSSAVFNIFFLVVLKLGIRGYISAFIIANSITAIYAALAGRSFNKYKNTSVNRKKAKEMVKFSSVLIPNTFMWWIMNSSDRVMVTAMVGSSQNGIYAISYKLPTLVSTITGMFNQAWCYSAIHEQGVEDEVEYNNRVFRSLISFAMIIGIGILTFTKPFLKMYVEKSYYEAWKYSPFLSIGCVYLTMGTFISSTYNVHKDSKAFLTSASIGAITNIVLNFLMIPSMKVYGAAIATCISYIVVFMFRLFDTKRYILFKINNREFIFGTILLVFAAIAIYFHGILGFAIQVIIFLITLIVYIQDWLPLIKRYLIRK